MFCCTELVEAAMYLYRATKDPYLLEIGEDMIQSIEHSTRTKCGYATVRITPMTSRLKVPGRVVQSVTCLATDASLTADPGVASSIRARSHTFVEIDHEIISTVILLPSTESFKKGCCQLQAKVCAQSTG